jgi:cyclic pyranopterin monophosphate synthase
MWSTIEYLRTMNELTHLDKDGNVNMVDVGGKEVTHRTAKAIGRVILPKSVMAKLEESQFQSKKGSVLQTAILAGIMGAKKTSDLIPLCHPLLLSKVEVRIEREREQELEQEREREVLVIYSEVKLDGKTGVEMEALTAVSIAALTIYDMCKALSHDIIISDIQLMEKNGGKNDFSRT